MFVLYLVYCSVQKDLYLMKSLKWFERGNTVPLWIQTAIDKCKLYIRNAVADDSPVPVTDCVSYSTSAQYTEGSLLRMEDFWKNLDWPEPLMAHCYVVMVITGIIDCSLYYVSLSARSLDCGGDLFDERGNFRATDKV